MHLVSQATSLLYKTLILNFQSCCSDTAMVSRRKCWGHSKRNLNIRPSSIPSVLILRPDESGQSTRPCRGHFVLFTPWIMLVLMQSLFRSFVRAFIPIKPSNLICSMPPIRSETAAIPLHHVVIARAGPIMVVSVFLFD